jgi:hypothetical protein
MLQGEGVMPDTFSLRLKWLRGDGRELFQLVRVGKAILGHGVWPRKNRNAQPELLDRVRAITIQTLRMKLA